MKASETKVSPATARPSSTAGDPSVKVAGDETRADITPLFPDDDTFIDGSLVDDECTSTEPVWFDEILVASELEIVETRKLRSQLTETWCELAQQRGQIDGLQKALELAILHSQVLEARCAAETDRARHADERACALVAERDDVEAAHRAALDKLEAQGATAVAAAYLWFARLNR